MYLYTSSIISSPFVLVQEILSEFILLQRDIMELGIQVPDFSIENLLNNHLERWIGSLAARMIG